MYKVHQLETQLPEPPYLSDTKWDDCRPEFSINDITLSDTWVLANPEQQAWILKIRFEAWQSRPIGSMPGNMEIFARRVGCTLNFLNLNSEILMRDWRLHSDGRRYHPDITEQVLKMLNLRHLSRSRKRKSREKPEKKSNKNSKSGQMSRVTPRDTRVTPCDAPCSEHVHSENINEINDIKNREHDKMSGPEGFSSRTRARAPASTFQKKKKIKKKKSSLQSDSLRKSVFVLPPKIDPGLWAAFEEHRRELHEEDPRRNPLLTDRARKMAASILSDLSQEEQRDVVRRTISSGWKTFFPDKKTDNIENKPTQARRVML